MTGGFKNMNADQIIKCILAAMLKLEKAVNNAIEGIQDKLDRGGYQGNAQDLSDSIESIYHSKEDKSNKNIANGYAGLDSNGKIIPTQLPQKTVSLTVPSGVPNDGDEWILYTL